MHHVQTEINLIWHHVRCGHSWLKGLILCCTVTCSLEKYPQWRGLCSQRWGAYSFNHCQQKEMEPINLDNQSHGADAAVQHPSNWDAQHITAMAHSTLSQDVALTSVCVCKNKYNARTNTHIAWPILALIPLVIVIPILKPRCIMR